MQFAGSQEVKGFRDVSQWLYRPDRIGNVIDVLRAIVVDVWLANRDRNWHNLIGQPIGGERINLIFIDFEKSVSLRPLPLMSTAELADKEFWPSGELGTLVRRWNFLHPPPDTIQKIAEFNEAHIHQLLNPIANAVGITWLDSTADALARRAAQIGKLAEGVWKSN